MIFIPAAISVLFTANALTKTREKKSSSEPPFDLETIKINLESLERRLRRLKIALVGMNIFVVLNVFVVVTQVVFSLGVSARFHQHLLALSDVMSEQERNGFLSRWALMRNQADFTAITAITTNLDNISKIRVRVLPP